MNNVELRNLNNVSSALPLERKSAVKTPYLSVNRKRSGTSLPVSCLILGEKYFSLYILLTEQISLSDFLFLLEMLGNMSIVVVCFPDCDVINFEINLNFPNKPCPVIGQKSQDKNLNILKTKRAFRMK